MDLKELEAAKDNHNKHCFVAIASGQTADERKFFEGWTQEVIKPAIGEMFSVQIASSSLEPTSITTDILEHLVHDPVAVFDLGGTTAESPANPNVMYELGIRHAFQLPSVILAWENQKLPFDVGDQRTVKIDRIPYHFEEARKRIREFVRNAASGRFYNPFESVTLRAQLQSAASGNDVLQLIAARLGELDERIEAIKKEHVTERVDTLRALMATQGVYLRDEPQSMRALRNIAEYGQMGRVDSSGPSQVPSFAGNLRTECEDTKD